MGLNSTPPFFVACYFSERSLKDSELQKLTLFEERCVDGYLREKDTLLHATQEEKIKVIGDRYVAQSLSPQTRMKKNHHLFLV